MQAEEHFALFVDNSGSVGRCTQYWDVVNTILHDDGKHIAHFYLWNSRCGAVTK